MREYRGRVERGVVIVEDLALEDGTVVRVIPVNGEGGRLGDQPAFGIWRDREDLPGSGAAARQLRERSSSRVGHE